MIHQHRPLVAFVRTLVVVLVLSAMAFVLPPALRAASSHYRCQWPAAPPDPFVFTIEQSGRWLRSPVASMLSLDQATEAARRRRDLQPRQGRFGTVPYRAAYDVYLEDYRHLSIDLDDLSPNKVPGFQRTAYLTNYIQGIHFFMVGILAMLPESVTNWDDEDKNTRGAITRWKENVREGPVKDSDDSYLNWLVHPWMGSGYYILARKSGLRKIECFAFSAFASTFLWEYGIEAIAEEPSQQDLWITPILGSALAEMAIAEEARVKRNGGRVWGSRFIGDIYLWLLNPFWRLTQSMARHANRLVHADFRTEFFREINVFPIEYGEDGSFYERIVERERIFGVRIKARF